MGLFKNLWIELNLHVPRLLIAQGSSHRWAGIFLHSDHFSDCEDSDSLLHKAQPSLQVPSGIVIRSTHCVQGAILYPFTCITNSYQFHSYTYFRCWLHGILKIPAVKLRMVTLTLQYWMSQTLTTQIRNNKLQLLKKLCLSSKPLIKLSLK